MKEFQEIFDYNTIIYRSPPLSNKLAFGHRHPCLMLHVVKPRVRNFPFQILTLQGGPTTGFIVGRKFNQHTIQ